MNHDGGSTGFGGCLCLVMAIWPICPLLAASIGSRKGDAIGSFLMGALLGPLGVILAVLSSGDGETATCPHCRGRVSPKARLCKHCRTALK